MFPKNWLLELLKKIVFSCLVFLVKFGSIYFISIQVWVRPITNSNYWVSWKNKISFHRQYAKNLFWFNLFPKLELNPACRNSWYCKHHEFVPDISFTQNALMSCWTRVSQRKRNLKQAQLIEKLTNSSYVNFFAALLFLLTGSMWYSCPVFNTEASI